MTNHSSTRSGRLDDPLAILARRECRVLLSYFRSTSRDAASVADLVSYASDRGLGRERRIELRLQHATLPRLTDAGVVDYDAANGTVRYRGDPELERLLEVITASDEDPPLDDHTPP